ncbi:MAG: SHOCT domain-containing protein [Nitrospiraceae bacterium]|nr:SHOCT domain-containing protein [Nitrospiraceae bacterium]
MTLLSSIVAQEGIFPWWHGHETPGEMGPAGPIYIAFIIILVLVIIFFLRTKRTRLPREESALDILKKRYARGEINKEEFERIKKDLKS